MLGQNSEYLGTVIPSKRRVSFKRIILTRDSLVRALYYSKSRRITRAAANSSPAVR